MKNTRTTFSLGMAALVIAIVLNVSRSQWIAKIGDVPGDGVLGFFYGIAIGLLVLSIVLRRKAQG